VSSLGLITSLILIGLIAALIVIALLTNLYFRRGPHDDDE
jgi:hypothetical protein